MELTKKYGKILADNKEIYYFCVQIEICKIVISQIVDFHYVLDIGIGIKA
jgi:hypothetical protein